jgi:hypothetical protein
VDLWWLSSGVVVLGHVLYGLPSRPGRAPARVSLHNGDDFSPADQSPRPDRLQAVRAVTAAGSRDLEVHGTPETGVSVDATGVAAPAWIVVETRPTVIELAPDTFHRYLTHEGLGQVVEARVAAGAEALPGREVYSKFAKTAVSDPTGTVPFLASAVGLPIEIVPLTTAPLMLGDVLHVRVLVDGRPAAGLQVRAHQRASEDQAPREVACVHTNRDGVVAVSIDATGLWRLHTIAMTAHDDRAAADWRSLWACLTFRLDSPTVRGVRARS